MPTVIVSLGSIVKTDATKTILAFQALANELHLNVQVKQLMLQLQPLFIDFNLGKLSVVDFQKDVEDIFFSNAHKKDDRSRNAFSDSFQSCWNAMCIVDDQAKEVMQYILAQIALNANSVIIYSDTNPLHLAFVMHQFNVDSSIVQTTFANGCAKDKLLSSFVNRLHISNPTDKIILLLGKNDQIKDPTLKAMTEERDADVIGAATSAEIKIERLEDPRVSISDLESLMPREERRRSISTSLPIIPAFNAMVVGRQQDSPRVDTDTQGARPADEPRRDRERSPSPT